MSAPPTILIATGNAGKAREFEEILGDSLRFETLKAFPNVGEVEETGLTFRANACLKASQYAQRTGQWTMADDSGLEVDALGGKPGVVSARWAMLHDAGQGDADNNALLLKQLAGVADGDRTARFVCVLAFSDAQGRIVATTRDTFEGRILRNPRGSNGFGYDPFFEAAGLGRTSAELSPAEKHAISHRGRALARMKAILPTVFGPGVLTGLSGNR